MLQASGVIVYHGTSTEAAAAILRDGFADLDYRHGEGHTVCGVFVTSDPRFASGFGEAVLAIELDAETASAISDDLDTWDETLLPAATLNRCPITSAR
jgi:hypothetical protein